MAEITVYFLDVDIHLANLRKLFSHQFITLKSNSPFFATISIFFFYEFIVCFN